MSFLGAETWQLRYQRNNKQSGLKNIRCFPVCSDPHRLSGFCGSFITVQLGQKPAPSKIAFGEFALKSAVTVQVGDILTNEVIKSNERTNADLSKPWHRGDVDKDLVYFNKRKKGWHYSWVSNKHTSESEHVFRVYVLDKIDAGYRCTEVFNSPAFTIFCRRRDKAGVARLPPQFVKQIKQQGESDEEDEEETASEDKKRRKSIKTIQTPSDQHLKKARSSIDASDVVTVKKDRRMKLSANPDDNIVYRILAALTNVHDRHQQQQQHQNAEKLALSPTSSSSPATPSTVANEETDDDILFDFSKAINDCWDWVSPEGDSDFFETFFAQPTAKPVEDLLIRLGLFLIKEDFTKEIEDVISVKNVKDKRDDGKRAILSVMKSKFEQFFKKEGTTLEKVDKELMINSPQLTEEKIRSPHTLFPNAISLESLPLINAVDITSLSPFRHIPGGIHDFTGHWRRPSSTLENLEKLRSIIGFSWIERKLMQQMESEFFIWYEGNTMFVRGQRKLAGSNCLIHIIDGREYPFVQPSAIGDDAPSIGLSNRTWATEDGMMHFCTTYTVEYRTIRSTRRSTCGNRLESTVTLQKNNARQLPGVWYDVFSYPALAERVIGIL